MIASILLSLAIASLPQSATKVTFAGPPGIAKEVLEKLSIAAGVSLETTMATSSDVIMVKVKDCPLPDLLARIASATGNAWKKEPNGYRLVRDDAFDKAEAAKERKALAERIEIALAKDPNAGKQAAEVRGPDGVAGFISLDRGPAEHAIVSMLQSVGSSNLASLGVGRRQVFATPANRMQAALSPKAIEVARKLIGEIKQEFEKRQAGGQRIRPFTPNDDQGMITGDPSLGLGKLLLAVQRISADLFDAQLIVTDPQGRNLALGNYGIVVPPATAGSGLTSSPKFEPSAETKSLAALLNPNAGGAGGDSVAMVAISVAGSDLGGGPVVFSSGNDSTAPVPADLRKKLTELNDNDPATFGLQEAMNGLAADSDLVACLPDQAIVPLLRSIARKAAPALVWTELGQHITAENKGEGWLVRPRSMIHTRARRANRLSLSKLLKAASEDGLVRLDDVATFAAAQVKPPTQSDIDGALMKLFAPGTIAETASSGFGGTWPVLRLFAQLSPAARQTLANGGTIPVSNLGPAAQTALLEDVFHSQDGPMLTAAQPQGPNARRITARSNGQDMMIAGWSGGLSSERTEFLPGGIDPRATLEVASRLEQAVVASDSKTGRRRLLSTTALALSQSGALAGGSKPEAYDLYRLATQGNYVFRFRLSPTATLSRTLSDAWTDRNVKPVSYDLLPENFRQRVDTLKSQFGNAKINFSSSTSTRGNPPP